MQYLHNKMNLALFISALVCIKASYKYLTQRLLASYSLASVNTPSWIHPCTAQEHTYKSQHEIILADLNWYTTTMHLVKILMDDAVKHTCVWPLV